MTRYDFNKDIAYVELANMADLHVSIAKWDYPEIPECFDAEMEFVCLVKKGNENTMKKIINSFQSADFYHPETDEEESDMCASIKENNA